MSWRSRNVASTLTLQSYAGGCGWLDRTARPSSFRVRRAEPLLPSSSGSELLRLAAGVLCWHSYLSSANLWLALSLRVCQLRAGGRGGTRDDVSTTTHIRTYHL